MVLDSLIHCSKMAIDGFNHFSIHWLFAKAMEVTRSSSSRPISEVVAKGLLSSFKKQGPMFKHCSFLFFQFYCYIISNTFQLSACIMFANGLLAKTSHMAMARHKGCRNRVYLLMGEAAKLHCIQIDMCTGMGRICDHFCILPHFKYGFMLRICL